MEKNQVVSSVLINSQSGVPLGANVG